MRRPRLAIPKRVPSVAAIDTCSNGVDTTAPRRTVGPTTIAGTRKPELAKFGVRIVGPGGGHVIEEAAVLVEDHDQQRARPLRALRHRPVDAGDERLAQREVVGRVAVVGLEVGVDDREVGQRPAAASAKKWSSVSGVTASSPEKLLAGNASEYQGSLLE